MTDAPFFPAAHGVIAAGLGLYARVLRHRLATARRLADTVVPHARVAVSGASRRTVRVDQHVA